MIYNPFKKNRQAGFSLIEVLISLFILAFVISGFIATVVVSVRAFRLSKARYLGTKIAEEGIELVINKRDNNVICAKSSTCLLSNPEFCGWQDGLLRAPGACPSLNDYDWDVDATETDQLLAGDSFAPYSSSSYICVKVSSGNKFGICADAETPIPGNYNRKIEILKIPGGLANAAVKVRSIVTWKSKGVNYGVTLEQVLFGL